MNQTSAIVISNVSSTTVLPTRNFTNGFTIEHKTFNETNTQNYSGKLTSTSTPCTTNVPTFTTTEKVHDEFGPPEGVEYIFVPLGVMVFVIVLTVIVIIISRKRKLEHLRHRLMPLYNFDPGEEGEDDWETELLDETFNTRQKRVSIYGTNKSMNQQ